MMKYALLAGVVALSAPLAAQTTPASPADPQTTQSAPSSTDQMAPTGGQAATAVDSAQPATAAAQPASPTQVAEVVSKEFPNYDKDGDGNLSAKEFDDWMVALKSASDPSTKATSPATKAWLNKAFAQADTDKNKKVSQTELTGFLSQQG